MTAGRIRTGVVMGHNPPPIERQVSGWGWWRDHGHAVGMLILEEDSLDPDERGFLRHQAINLAVRGFHPMTAITLVMEGFIDTAVRVGPSGFRGARTWEHWLARFEGYERTDRHGRRR